MSSNERRGSTWDSRAPTAISLYWQLACSSLGPFLTISTQVPLNSCPVLKPTHCFLFPKRCLAQRAGQGQCCSWCTRRKPEDAGYEKLPSPIAHHHTRVQTNTIKDQQTHWALQVNSSRLGWITTQRDSDSDSDPFKTLSCKPWFFSKTVAIVPEASIRQSNGLCSHTVLSNMKYTQHIKYRKC